MARRIGCNGRTDRWGDQDVQISRRTLLIGAAATLTAGVGTLGLVETGVLPGRSGFHQSLGLTGPAGKIPDIAPGTVIDGAFASRARGGVNVGYSIIYPSTPDANLPICLYLGGRGFTHRSVIDDLGFDRFLASLVAAGSPPFAVVTVDGGAEYWHPRLSGDDPQAMLTDELLPQVAAAGHPVERMCVAGLSMGGYGALLLAETLGQAAVSGVAVMSPAIFDNFESSAPGAFDSPDDFAAHDVVARARDGVLSGMPVRIDCGADDPFSRNTERLMQVLGQAVGGTSPGLHDADFWLRLAPEQLTFVGAHLPTL